MVLRLSGTACAVFMIIFFVLSTLSPISHVRTENIEAFEFRKSLAHTDFEELSRHTPMNHNDVRAMWFPYFEYKDSLQGKTEQEFTENIELRFSNAKEIGINTVYVHVRSHGDAYYFSDIFPMASRCKGTIGAPIDFDPLEIMTEVAHNLDLSIHAWINPLRLMTVEDMLLLSDEFILRQWYNDAEKNGTYIVNVENLLYLNPAYSETRELVCSGIEEILHGYDIDGIHIDDYFYPTTDVSFDSTAFAASGYTDLESWRYANTNALVKEIYKTVKDYDQNVLFGISPVATDIANKALYADVDLWCSQKGFCDYIVPQIYFGYESQAAPFSEMLSLWKEKCSYSNVKLVIGICTYKYAENTEEWSQADITSRQLEDILYDDKISGAAIYSYSATFEPTINTQLYDQVRNNIKSVLTKEAI